MSLYHIRYTIEFLKDEYRNMNIYNDFRDNLINNHKAYYTLDATCYIYSNCHIDDFETGVILLELENVLRANHINITHVDFKYDICDLADPPNRKIKI